MSDLAEGIAGDYGIGEVEPVAQNVSQPAIAGFNVPRHPVIAGKEIGGQQPASDGTHKPPLTLSHDAEAVH